MTEHDHPPATRDDIEAMHRPDAWTPEQLLTRLDALGFKTTTIEHDPMWTVEDSQRLRTDSSEVVLRSMRTVSASSSTSVWLDISESISWRWACK